MFGSEILEGRFVDSRSDQGTYADILIGQSKEPLAKSKGSLANIGNAATMTTKSTKGTPVFLVINLLRVRRLCLALGHVFRHAREVFGIVRSCR